MIPNYVVAAVAFLVLACLLACLVAWARARRKPLLPDGVLVENIRPGRRRLHQGGVHGEPHGATLATTSTAAATAATVPVFDGLAVAPPAVTIQLPVAADLGSNNPKDIMFGINSEPQAFNLVGKAGNGGVKSVSYIDEMKGDWVLALPIGKELDMWTRLVEEELKMASELHALGIPCLEMYGVICAPTKTEAGVYQGLALKMRSFDNYQRMGKTVIYDRNMGRKLDDMKAMIKRWAYQWMARGIDYATAQLCNFLAPLVQDIRTLAQECSVDVDSLNWQIVYSDDELKHPLHARIFLFDLAAPSHAPGSLLVDAGESEDIKRVRTDKYLSSYLDKLMPYDWTLNDDDEEYLPFADLEKRACECLGTPLPEPEVGWAAKLIR